MTELHALVLVGLGFLGLACWFFAILEHLLCDSDNNPLLVVGCLCIAGFCGDLLRLVLAFNR